jgi:hypothetical protein
MRSLENSLAGKAPPMPVAAMYVVEGANYPAAALVIHIPDNCVEVFGPDGPFQIWLGGFDEKERVDNILGGSNLMPSQAASGVMGPTVGLAREGPRVRISLPPAKSQLRT